MELKALLGEGRAQVGGRPARNGVDFARAVATLGVDRGIGAFQRYGFQVRNGLAYFATPLERVAVRKNKLASQLLAPIDDWLNRFRGKAFTEGSPSSVQRAARALEAAIIAFCKSDEKYRVQELLVSLGQCEASLASSWKWTREAFLSPVPLLSSRWLRDANTGTAEFRLAAALASVRGFHGNAALPLRCHLEPVKAEGGREKRWYSWTDTIGPNVVWQQGDFAGILNAIFSRRLINAAKNGSGSVSDSSVIPAYPTDIAAFIEGRTDDRLLCQLLWGMVLIDFNGEYSSDFKLPPPAELHEPPALYVLLKLCHSRHEIRGKSVPIVPAIHQRARAGDGFQASRLAARRLRASGLAPAIDSIPNCGAPVARTAAALLFPVTEYDLASMSNRVLRPNEQQIQPTPTKL
jgi:CRISPR-associated protein Csx17